MRKRSTVRSKPDGKLRPNGGSTLKQPCWCIVISLVILVGLGCSGHQGSEAQQTEKPEQLQATLLVDLCSSDTDCSGLDACSVGLCVAGVCVQADLPGCCEVDSDCDQDVVCSVASCIANECVSTPLAQCAEADAGSVELPAVPLDLLCETNADCNDSDPCTDDLCLSETGICVFADNPLCCQTDVQCEGLLACHVGACVDDRCTLSLLDGCNADEGGNTGTTTEPADAGTNAGDSGHDPISKRATDKSDDGAQPNDDGGASAMPDPSRAVDESEGAGGEPATAVQTGSEGSPDQQDSEVGEDTTDSAVSSSEEPSGAQSSTTEDVSAEEREDGPGGGVDTRGGDDARPGVGSDVDSGVACPPGQASCENGTVTSELTGGACSIASAGIPSSLYTWLLAFAWLLPLRRARRQAR